MEDMINQINYLCDSNQQTIICGDLKIPQKDWKHLNADIVCQPSMKCMINNYIEQRMEVHTRDYNILDLVLPIHTWDELET